MNENQSLEDNDLETEKYLKDSYEIPKGWNLKSDLDVYLKQKNNKDLNKKIIQKACKALPLSKVLFTKNNIEWIVSDNPSGWTHKCKCLFSDHEDSTPSFGYNSKDDRFFCFGCQRGGNSVQFLSFFEHREAIEVAKDILCKYNKSDDLIIELEDSSSDKVDDLLQAFSEDIRKFLRKNNNEKAIKIAENLTWSLDVYIEKNVHSSSYDVESLASLIKKLRYRLDNVDLNLHE